MKKNRIVAIVLVFAVCVCTIGFVIIRLLRSDFTVYNPPHSVSKEYIWYCIPPHVDHTQPQPTEKAKFICDYPVIYVGSPTEKAIYLTFDDPAEDKRINDILDILLKHGASAAFFLNEKYMRDYPKTIRRMVLDGHFVCNHTDKHIRISTVKEFDRFKEELSGVEEAYEEATGMELPKYFRPPRGRFTELTLKFAEEMGYTTVFWSYSYVDWQKKKQPSQAKAVADILAQTHNGEIILLHTQSSTNIGILDELLTQWTKMGFVFKSLDEISRIPIRLEND